MAQMQHFCFGAWHGCNTCSRAWHIRVNLRELTGGTVASKNLTSKRDNGNICSRWLRKISTNLAGDATDKLFTPQSCICDSIMNEKRE